MIIHQTLLAGASDRSPWEQRGIGTVVVVEVVGGIVDEQY